MNKQWKEEFEKLPWLRDGFVNREMLKDFISKLLREKEQAILDKIKKVKEEYDQDDMIKYEALVDLIQHLEVEEMPLFKGTKEQLDNLTIKGE